MTVNPTPTNVIAPATQRPRPVRSGIRTALSSHPLGAWIPAIVITIYVLVAIFGPMLVPYDPVHTPLLDRLLPPGTETSTGGTAILGTDATGRDVFAQVIYGTRTSLIVGAATVVFSGVVGLVIGVLAGYLGGIVDATLSRIIDVFLAFPGIVLAIVVAGLFERGIIVVVVALSLPGWISFARLSRSSALSLQSREWVHAAHVMGVGPVSTMRRHVLPFVIGPIGALVTIEFGLFVLSEAGLSFLGIGLPPTVVSWGQTIAAGKDYLATSWWISAFPGITLAVLLLMVGLLGDQLNSRYQRGVSL